MAELGRTHFADENTEAQRRACTEVGSQWVAGEPWALGVPGPGAASVLQGASYLSRAGPAPS